MELIRHILPSLAAGSIAGLAASCAIVGIDIGGCRELILNDTEGWIAMLLLASGFVVTFGSAAAGAAIMRIGADDADE